MPLEPYEHKTSKYLWIKGWVEFEGTRIAGPYRCSSGSSTKAGAESWIAAETDYQRRKHMVGEEAAQTFSDAILLYSANAKAAKQLLPIDREIGDTPLTKITGKLLKSLGPKMKPLASTDTWWREIVTPARAVINNAHELRGTPAIKVRQYSSNERVAQDTRRKKTSRVARTPSDRQWVADFCKHADPHNAALLRFMFETAARIDQAVSLTPSDIDADECQVWLKAQKGHDAGWVKVSRAMMEELLALPKKFTRSPRTGKLLEQRVFGYNSSTSYNNRWKTICKKADIPYLSAHAAGRHGYYTELVVRQDVNALKAAKAGRWSDASLPMRVYAHPEVDEASLREHFRTKPVQPKPHEQPKNLKLKGKSDVN
ncbi:phage integrase family protein [Yoonia maricola]|uniref:Phage integrase family protein n=1 Tax=Yoonia maricola TaxID=420999 RepID=A0A2M8W4Z6_9RHOB|nr:tyrosine-type recombinase/integrase [Yoonia maricola]PJI86002.1 phage integrase family protein [Yoonia maricola]